ncbi:type II toxin-antitoxin system RatA family toxin [Conexibacter sp. SYSU D00693]|uniref:type II toxin-antitoxin system RatA family toxin n=1 Tax=Conexibacter sp. SYSU D00693 TaxID=2812560 RepID=UPI00196A35BC|nr:SRPBCC family protein [Conexibacter sp. SYSU D00693]
MANLGGSHTVEIDAPIERCFEIAADIEGAPKWQGSMKRVEVHERDAEGRATVVTTIADAKVKEVKTKLRFAYQPLGGMTWEQEKGDLKWLKGSWTFEDLGGRTRATYEMEGEPGRMLGMLIKGPVEQTLRHVLVKVPAEGLKREAEGS